MIARDSTSYPYLAIAQHYDVPYGMVLAYADALELTHGNASSFYSISFSEASKHLRRDVQTAILNTWRKENDRREAVRSVDILKGHERFR